MAETEIKTPEEKLILNALYLPTLMLQPGALS